MTTNDNKAIKFPNTGSQSSQVKVAQYRFLYKDQKSQDIYDPEFYLETNKQVVAVEEVNQVFVFSPNIPVLFGGEASSRKSSLSRFTKELVTNSRSAPDWLKEVFLTEATLKGIRQSIKKHGRVSATGEMGGSFGKLTYRHRRALGVSGLGLAAALVACQTLVWLPGACVPPSFLLVCQAFLWFLGLAAISL